MVDSLPISDEASSFESFANASSLDEAIKPVETQ